jgi:hypothetical protein
VRGEIAVAATVTPESIVKFVDFYIQEPGAKDRYSWKEYGPQPYVWGGKGQKLDTRLFADGPASVVLFCYTGGRTPALEKRVSFVIDNGRPVVKILTPSDGALVGEHVAVELEATDPKGINADAGIVAVSLYVDGSFMQKLTSAPYRFHLEGCLLSPGLHSIRAVAEDTEGLVGADRIMMLRPKRVSK